MPRHGMPFETSNPQAGDHKQPFFRQLNKTGPTRCAAFLAPSIQAIVVVVAVVAAAVATVAQSERPSVVHECLDATIPPLSLCHACTSTTATVCAGSPSDLRFVILRELNMSIIDPPLSREESESPEPDKIAKVALHGPSSLYLIMHSNLRRRDAGMWDDIASIHRVEL